jgi:WD40 repeat protein
LAISPQGTRLICGSEDKMIRVWDLETKKIAHTVYPTDKSSLGERSYRGPFNPDGHAGTVTCLAYSPDGSRFVSGSYDRMIKVWDAEGEHLYTLPPSAGWHSSESLGWKGYTGPFNPEGHSSCVDSVQFSASGSKLLSASFDRTIKVWDSVTGSMLTAIHPESRASYASGGLDPEGHTEAVTCAVFSPDESKIISGSDDYTVRAWDARSGKRLSILYPSEGPSTFTSDDPHIPYDGQTNRHGHASKVTSLAFSPCGGYFISSGEDRTVRAWNAASFENIFVKEFDRAVACVAISKDGVRMAVGSYDNTVRVYNVERS